MGDLGDWISAPVAATERRWLEAQLVADRYLDPSTGLPRLPLLTHRLSRVEGGGDVAIVTATIDGFDDIARRRGHGEAERLRRELGTALRALLATDRADVAVGAPGRFLIVGPDLPPPAGRLEDVVEEIVEGVRVRHGALTAVWVAAGSAPSAAHAAYALSGGTGFVVPTAGDLTMYAEPIVAVHSGRLRGLHVRGSSWRSGESVLPAATLAALAADDVAQWSEPFARAVGTVWIDVPMAETSFPSLLDVVRDRWLLQESAPRLGLRLRPDGLLDPMATSALRAMAAEGVQVSLAGLSTGLVDPPGVDRSVFQEIVIDPGLVAGATGNVDDAALAWGLAGLAFRHGMCTTADGVDDTRRMRLAVSLGAWRAEGAFFGPLVPLADAPAAWSPRDDLRPAAWRSSAAPAGSVGPAARRPTRPDSGHAGLRQLAARLDVNRPRAEALIASWLDEAATPAHVRRLLTADRDGQRWTLAEASLLVALVAV